MKAGSARKRRPVVEEIEPRILYSADFAPGLVDADAFVPEAEQRVVEASGEYIQASFQESHDRRHEIVFVDSATPDYAKLVEDIRGQAGDRDVEVMMLDAGKDGIRQITKTLAGREDISAVHIVSHGADGAVQLGKTTLDFDSLLKNASKIKSWGSALTDNADILIYGCEVAATQDGKSLVEALARLTGADVAASDDLTGAAQLGGDWDLEFHAGNVETSIVFSQSVMLDWNATLQATASGGETRANTSTTGTQATDPDTARRSVAMDASGNYVVVWAGNGTTAGNLDADGVFAQRYNASGVAQGVEIRVNTVTANNQHQPSVAMDANGNFVVAWASDGQDGGGSGVYAQRYNAAGTAQGAAFLVNTTTANDQVIPFVAMNASGTFVIAWEADGGQDGAGAGVYAQRYNAAGAAQGAEFRVNVTTAGDQNIDDLAMDSAGNFIVTWSGNGSDPSGNGVYSRRYDAAGNALSGEVRVNTTTADSQDWSSVSMDASGDYVVVWRSNLQDGASGGIYGQRYDASGVAQGGEFRVNTMTANDQAQPVVSMDPNGNFVVVWQSYNQDAGANTWGVYKQDYNADGTAFGGEVRVSTSSTGDQRYAGVAMNALGQYVVVWGGNGTVAGQTDASGVFFQRYTSGLVVDTTADTIDGTTTSIANLLANKGGDGKISLREAITAANNTANVGGPDRIYFNIAGAGPHTITLTYDGPDAGTAVDALPTIIDAVIIDGRSEPNYTGTPVIEINGNGLGANGLTLSAGSSGSEIRGLVINRFAGTAIRVMGSSDNVIAGNYLGTNVAGTAALGNQVGVYIGGSATANDNNRIGGTTAADRNVISGNSVDGIQINGAGGGTSGTLVQGNYIGLNVAGTADLGNAAQGIAIWGSNTGTQIGGTAAGAGNVISGNNGMGVGMSSAGTTGTLVQGNYIGTNAAGTAAIGNSSLGLEIASSSSNNVIGGTAAGARNVISGNLGFGVRITGANNNQRPRQHRRARQERQRRGRQRLRRRFGRERRDREHHRRHRGRGRQRHFRQRRQRRRRRHQRLDGREQQHHPGKLHRHQPGRHACTTQPRRGNQHRRRVGDDHRRERGRRGQRDLGQRAGRHSHPGRRHRHRRPGELHRPGYQRHARPG